MQSCQNGPELGPAHSRPNQKHRSANLGLESAHFKLGLADVKCQQPPYQRVGPVKGRRGAGNAVTEPRGHSESRPAEQHSGVSQPSRPAVAPGEHPGLGCLWAWGSQPVLPQGRAGLFLPRSTGEPSLLQTVRCSSISITLISPRLVGCKLRPLL